MRAAETRGSGRRPAGRTLGTGPVAAVLTALALSSACSAGGPARTAAADRDGRPSSGATRVRTVGEYVALGDSFTAAPYVPVTDLAGGCLRSSGNYPSLLASAGVAARLRDVSCSGATTSDILSPQALAGGRGRARPQLRAVRPTTDLVTVGIGGNDEGLFGRLTRGCFGPGFRPLRRCVRTAGLGRSRSAAVLARTERRVAEVLRRVHAAAPRAEVLLVGYPRLVDPARSCPGLPLAAADRSAAARVERLLDAAMRSAARAAGAGFVDMYAVSRGHEICSADPWVNGSSTDQTRALAFHPFAVEQRQVARAVQQRLARVQAGSGIR